jgi:hypothetical protein
LSFTEPGRVFREASPRRVFREAWIAGVTEHYPGEPKRSYITPWDDTPQWEREAAGAVEAQVREFINAAGRGAAKLSRQQKGQFFALCWIAQIYKHIEAPKASYVADWPDLPKWQQETDADIFEAVERQPRR